MFSFEDSLSMLTTVLPRTSAMAFVSLSESLFQQLKAKTLKTLQKLRKSSG